MFCFFSRVTPFHYLIALSLSEERNLYARMNLFVHIETPQLKLKKCRQHPPRFWVTRVGIWAGLGTGGRISGREGKELRA